MRIGMLADQAGVTAIHSGRQVLGLWGEAQAGDCAAGGNLLAGELVPVAMVAAFSGAKGHLGERLMLALEGGLQGGGAALPGGRHAKAGVGGGGGPPG